MIDYMVERIEKFPESIENTARTPATRNLFKIERTASLLTQNNADIFHNTVAKLLRAAKRAHADIENTVAFLCTKGQDSR